MNLFINNLYTTVIYQATFYLFFIIFLLVCRFRLNVIINGAVCLLYASTCFESN